MNIARGLLNDPWILFLDEPTLGLDVAAARVVREFVLDWKAAVAGRTVLLTTHYMAEADELCDRIAIVDHGRILAIGTPDELKKRVQRESIFRLELDQPRRRPAALARLPGRRLGGAARPTSIRTSSASPSTSSWRRTRRWAAWSPRSAASAATSSPCASRSPRSRTCSSSWSGAGSATMRSTEPRRRPTTARTRPRATISSTASRTCRRPSCRRSRGGRPVETRR